MKSGTALAMVPNVTRVKSRIGALGTFIKHLPGDRVLVNFDRGGESAEYIEDIELVSE